MEAGTVSVFWQADYLPLTSQNKFGQCSFVSLVQLLGMYLPLSYIIIIIWLLWLLLSYPRIYNAQELNTERIKTAKMARGPECHQWSHCAKAPNWIVVLQQTGTGKESRPLALLQRGYPIYVQDLSGTKRWRAEGTQILHSDWLENMVWWQIVILLSLSLCCHFRYHPHASCCSVDIRLSQCAYNCDIPNQRLTNMPLD